MDADVAGGSSPPRVVRTQLLVDCMGAFSPIANQSRQGAKPETAVMLVGTCSEGVGQPTCGDLLWADEGMDLERKVLVTEVVAMWARGPRAAMEEWKFDDYLLLTYLNGLPLGSEIE